MSQSRELSPVPRTELAKLVAQRGPDLATRPSLVGALLRDLAGDHRLEISLLVAAAEEGVPAEFSRTGDGSLTDVAVVQFARRLEENRGLSPSNASWAASAWADAMAPPAAAPGQSASPPGLDSPTITPNPSGAAGVAAPPPPPGSGAPADPKPSRQPQPLVIGAVVLLVLAIGGLIFALTHKSGPAVASPTISVSIPPTDSFSPTPTFSLAPVSAVLPAGPYRVGSTITSRVKYSGNGWHRTFGFSSGSCTDAGACLVRVKLSGGTGTLTGSQQRLTGDVHGAIFLACNGTNIPNERVHVEVFPTKVVAGVVGQFTGKISVVASAFKTCSASRYTAVLFGTHQGG